MVPFYGCQLWLRKMNIWVFKVKVEVSDSYKNATRPFLLSLFDTGLIHYID